MPPSRIVLPGVSGYMKDNMLNGHNHTTEKFRRRSMTGTEYANAIYKMERKRNFLPLYAAIALVAVFAFLACSNQI